MPVAVPGTWRGVVNRYKASAPEVQLYFEDVPELIEKYDWEVSLSFMFSRVEKALNTMLYCGARKMHRANSDVARHFVDAHHMTRKEFRRLFKNVFGQEIPADTTAVLSEAEKVRDKILHGKTATESDKRKAIVSVLQYSEEMNTLVQKIAGFKPFVADLRGFTGRGEALDESTTKWLMKGLGFLSKASGDVESG
jgi:hypothetical protein